MVKVQGPMSNMVSMRAKLLMLPATQTARDAINHAMDFAGISRMMNAA